MHLKMLSAECQQYSVETWWHHPMETFSALLAICAGIDRHWWFETPLHPLWRHCKGSHGVNPGTVNRGSLVASDISKHINFNICILNQIAQTYYPYLWCNRLSVITDLDNDLMKHATGTGQNQSNIDFWRLITSQWETKLASKRASPKPAINEHAATIPIIHYYTCIVIFYQSLLFLLTI